MKKPCILRILAKILEHQERTARILAETHIHNPTERLSLLCDVLLNKAEFARLVPEFQMQIEPRSPAAAIRRQ